MWDAGTCVDERCRLSIGDDPGLLSRRGLFSMLERESMNGRTGGYLSPTLS